MRIMLCFFLDAKGKRARFDLVSQIDFFFCFPSFFVYNYAAFSYLSSVYFTEGIKAFSFFYFVFIVFHISAKQSPSVIHYKKKETIMFI